MNGNVNLYDTYKANKDGKRYRVTEVGNETVKLVKINDVGDRKHAGGRPRNITVADLFRDFTKVNLPPVTVSKIEPQKPKQEEVEEVGTPSENAAEKQKQTVREINNPKAHTLEDTFEEFREKNQPNVKNVTVTVDGREIREQITHEKELDVLKAELKEKLQECIDLKKTISKMNHQHQAEVADLNDRIMEAEAEANAIRKSKDEILHEREQYSDALDNDSMAFEEILQLAVLMERGAKSMHEVSKMIQAKTEGRI